MTSLRTLGVDFGARRVGLALSDEEATLASPLEVLAVSSPQAAVAQILRIIQQQGVQRLVIGLPLNMDDSIGPSARAVIHWGRQLASQSGIPAVFVDERLSSFDAEQQLIDRKRAGEKLTRKRKKQQLDAIAAASFLQGYLDGKLPELAV